MHFTVYYETENGFSGNRQFVQVLGSKKSAEAEQARKGYQVFWAGKGSNKVFERAYVVAKTTVETVREFVEEYLDDTFPSMQEHIREDHVEGALQEFAFRGSVSGFNGEKVV